MTILYTRVSDEAIDIETLRVKALNAESGAVVTFSGTVRDNDKGKVVTALDYEIHPSADQVLKDVAAEILSEFTLTALVLEHRFGKLKIGDVAFGVVVASRHREVAFAACSAVVDRVKDKLPIWKNQFFNDGTDEWVNSA